MYAKDTICAIATATGNAGIGIIRISGPKSFDIACKIIKFEPKPRYAHYLPFYDQHQIIDYGISIYFPAPNSLTGESVVELQGHGGKLVLQLLLKRCLELGARQAQPGEFLQRAFLNDKIDLAQVESIADLINANTEKAARSALRSLSGEFSKAINRLIEKLIHLRMYVESAIDFPEEEIDFLSDGHIEQQLELLLESVVKIELNSQQGKILRDGMSIAITGQPNVGKSSLLNALSGEETAIVSDIAGTTRDVIKQQINIDGMPVHLIDTAGLRESICEIEQIGIKRAWQEIEQADCIIIMVDANSGWQEQDQKIIDAIKNKHKLLLFNKIDQTGHQTEIQQHEDYCKIYLSAKQHQGLDLLRQHLKDLMGFNSQAEGVFSARTRHLQAIAQSKKAIQQAKIQLIENKAGELVAEELLQAQHYLSEITGEFSADDLLGKIFSDFCIGK